MKYLKLFEQYINTNNNTKQLIAKIHSDEAFEILDQSKKASGTSWQYGGCWILADALIELWKDLEVELYVVYNNIEERVEHFMVKIGKTFFDSDGFQSEYQLKGKIIEDHFHKYSMNDFEIKPYDVSMNTSDIVRDIKTSLKLVKYFKNETINENNNFDKENFITNTFINGLKNNRQDLINFAIEKGLNPTTPDLLNRILKFIDKDKDFTILKTIPYYQDEENYQTAIKYFKDKRRYELAEALATDIIDRKIYSNDFDDLADIEDDEIYIYVAAKYWTDANETDDWSNLHKLITLELMQEYGDNTEDMLEYYIEFNYRNDEDNSDVESLYLMSDYKI